MRTRAYETHGPSSSSLHCQGTAPAEVQQNGPGSGLGPRLLENRDLRLLGAPRDA
jgi:hypothetical protein